MIIKNSRNRINSKEWIYEYNKFQYNLLPIITSIKMPEIKYDKEHLYQNYKSFIGYDVDT